MSPSENRRSSGRRHGSDDPADGDRRRQQPEPDLVHAEPLVGVQDEHRPGGPERDVEGEDRERERPHRRMGEEPADALGHLGAEAAPRPGAPSGALVTTREISTAPSAKQTAFVANGSAIPTANRNAPIGGATAGSRSRTAPCIRALATPRSSRRTRPGSRVLLAESANVSAVPSTNSATRTTAMLTTSLTIVATSTSRTAAGRGSPRRPSAADRTDRRRRRRARRTAAPAGTRSAAPSRRGTGPASARRRAAGRRRARCRRRRC